MTEAPSDRSDAGPSLGLPLVLAVLTCARVVALWLSATDLFFDEAQYWEWSRELAWGYYSKPPVIAWLIALSTSVCGDGEACVRLASPLVHAATAFLVYLAGRQLYDERTGFWSAIVYATLPGISVSSGIISTDVPLLFCWALALLSVLRLRAGGGWRWALLLGIGVGLGLLSKYAMVLFLPCALLASWVVRGDGRGIGVPKAAAALAAALATVSPNLLWNAANGFATFSHTADNANWGGDLFRPGKALEFFGAQFGVFGPVLFAALLVIAWRATRRPLPAADRLLLAFCLPVILLFMAQAFVSRAHANWAAVAYVAGTLLVTATMLRDGAWRARWGSLVLHLALAALIPLGMALAGRMTLPGGVDPLARLVGWRALGEAAKTELANGSYRAVLADDRAIVAELVYYLREVPVPVLAWKGGDQPRDHYELTRPYRTGSPQPVLLVSLTPDIASIAERFQTVRALPSPPDRATAGGRKAFLFVLDGFRAR